jgi:hypothetical protein
MCGFQPSNTDLSMVLSLFFSSLLLSPLRPGVQEVRASENVETRREGVPFSLWGLTSYRG